MPGGDEAQDAVHLPAIQGDARLEARPTAGEQRLVAQVVRALAQQHERLVAQLRQAHPTAARGQRVRARQRQQELFLQQRQRLQGGVPNRLDHHRQVQLAVLEQLHAACASRPRER